jgi:RimJ/RimL family protein N-acetyltransferase
MVRLRAVEPDDLPVFYEHQLDEEAAAMAAFVPRDRDAFTAHWQRILRDERCAARTILADDEAVGNVVAWWTDDGDRLVGYWIGKPFWGRGIATEALAAFLAEEPTRPLQARVSDRNRGSIRVLEKCGFRPVAREDGGDGVVDLVYELKA